MTQYDDLVRRKDGVTYLPTVQLAELVEMSRHTVRSWLEAGVVAQLPKMGNRRFGSVADVVRLKLEPPSFGPKHTGEYRTPQRTRDARAAAYRKSRDATRKQAVHRHELWESEDIARMVEMRLRGASYRDIALALGRTTAAVQLKAWYVDAVIRHRVEGGIDWLERSLKLLTAEEKQTILTALERIAEKEEA